MRKESTSEKERERNEFEVLQDNCKLSFDEIRRDETREKRNSQIQRTRRAALSYAHLTIAQCVIVPDKETTMHSSNI